MQQNNKYFGMTPLQLRILAGLAVTACLIFALAGSFVLRGSFNRSTAPPGSAPVSKSTATPWSIPSLVPTGSPTAVPYETLIPGGWSQFKTGLVELWLPADFEPGDLNSSTIHPIRR
jgi:hypothetical protein